MGTIATSVLCYYLEAFDTDPPLFSRRIRRYLQNSPNAFLREASVVLRDAPDAAGTHFLLAVLASDESLGAIVLDDSFPRNEAIRIVRMLSRTSPGAALNLVQAGGGLTHVLRGAPERVLRLLELIGATSDLAVGAGVLALFLKHPSPEVRSKAALLLGRSNRDLAWVSQKLDDADPRIRANAVESIWGVMGGGAAAVFTRAMADPDNRVAGNACLGLYLCGDPAASDAIVEMSAHGSARFRATAAWVMGEVASEAFERELDRLRQDEDADVRHGALRATMQIRRSRASGPARG